MPDRVARSVARLTHEPEVPGSIPGPVTYFRFSFSYWRKYVHEVLAKVVICGKYNFFLQKPDKITEI